MEVINSLLPFLSTGSKQAWRGQNEIQVNVDEQIIYSWMSFKDNDWLLMDSFLMDILIKFPLEVEQLTLPFAELAGVRPGEKRKPLVSTWKAKLEKEQRWEGEVRWNMSVNNSWELSFWLQKKKKNTSSCPPFPSWGRCRCLCTAETSPARPWPEPVWCASPPPQWEPGTP